MLILVYREKPRTREKMWYKLLYKAGARLDTNINVNSSFAQELQSNLPTYPLNERIHSVTIYTNYPRKSNNYIHYKVPSVGKYVSIIGMADLYGWPDKRKLDSKRRINDDKINAALEMIYGSGSMIVRKPSYNGQYEYRYYLQKNEKMCMRIITDDEWPNASLDLIAETIDLEGVCHIYKNDRLEDTSTVPDIIYPHEIRFFNDVTGEGGVVICEYNQIADIETLLTDNGFDVLSTKLIS